MVTNAIKRIFFLSLICAASCFSNNKMMTHNSYDTLKTGTPVSELTAQAGKPYAIHVKEDGSEEYEYIERIDNGVSVIAENHYFIVVREGEVVGKYMTRETPPAYDLIYQEEPNYPN